MVRASALATLTFRTLVKFICIGVGVCCIFGAANGMPA